MTAKLNRKWATRSKFASNNTALTEATNLYKRKTLQVPEAAPPTEVQRRSKAFSAVGLDWFPVEVNWTSGRRTAYQLWHTALTLATGPQSGGGRRETVYPPPPGHAHFHMWRSSRQRHKTTAVSEKIHRSSRIQMNVLISVEIKLLLLNEGKNKYPDHVTSLHQSHLPQTINPFKCKSETIRGCRLHFLTFQWNVTQCDKLEKICTISADHCVYCVADQ